MITEATKVSEVVIETPQAAALLEQLHIDYCCGGDRPIAQACLDAGVELDEFKILLQRLQQNATSTAESTDFHQMSLSDLISYILTTHHVYTKTEMNNLAQLNEKVVSAHRLNHPELELMSDLLQSLCADLKSHMFKEEQILFPYVQHLEISLHEGGRHLAPPFGSVGNPIRMMMSEHDTAGDLLKELRRLSGDYKPPVDACWSYRAFYRSLEAFEVDLHQHIHLENNILFPRTMAMEEMMVSR